MLKFWKNSGTATMTTADYQNAIRDRYNIDAGTRETMRGTADTDEDTVRMYLDRNEVATIRNAGYRVSF